MMYMRDQQIKKLLEEMVRELSQEIGTLYEDYGVPPEEFIDYSCAYSLGSTPPGIEKLMGVQEEA